MNNEWMAARLLLKLGAQYIKFTAWNWSNRVVFQMSKGSRWRLWGHLMHIVIWWCCHISMQNF